MGKWILSLILYEIRTMGSIARTQDTVGRCSLAKYIFILYGNTPWPPLEITFMDFEQVLKYVIMTSVQFSCSIMSDSLRPHELQHARPPCPSPTPGVHSDSRPSSQWCHQDISSSGIPFSFCPKSLPASEFFPMRWPKYWSFSFSIIPSKEIPGLISFRMDWLDLLAVQGTLRVFSNTTVQKHQFFGTQPS